MTCREGHAPRHEDFEPGNVVALKSGSRSQRVVDPLAAELVALAASDAPWLREPKYRASVEAWSRAEAQARLLHEWLLEHGLHDKEGRLRNAEQAMHRAETRAANARNALGLTPLASARLGRDRASTAVDLAHLWAQQDADAARESGGEQ